jgi:hypothetical protein
LIENPGKGVGFITLRSDSFIPVMVRVCGFLQLNFPEPGVFPGRLVKVPMDANKLFQIFTFLLEIVKKPSFLTEDKTGLFWAG